MISVISPSIRPEGLEIVKRSLRRQTHEEYEWIVASPFEYKECDLWLPDPPKKEGDFWSLCKAWNNAYAHAKGELVVNIQDMIYVEPDTLEKFWYHFQDNPNHLVTAVGDHYDETLTNKVWSDPRKRSDQGIYYEIDTPDMEMSVCSVPKQAILDCGGIDEEYDKGPGVQEKEMCLRLSILGYKMYIDQSIEYKGIRHGRLTEDWDDKYFKVTAPMYTKHVEDLMKVKRPLNVSNIEKYLS